MIGKICASIGLVALGAGGMYVVTRPSVVPASMNEGVVPPSRAADVTMPADARVLQLTPDAVSRAGIEVVTAAVETGGLARRLPAIVEPNAYRVVDVTPIVSGTVVSMAADLGDELRVGAAVARLRSPELTDEVRRWLTVRAERNVVDSRLMRTQGLTKIGAASRQELEEVQAELVRVDTELGTARARLARLGFTDAALQGITQGDAVPETIDVGAPAAGVVIRRTANAGQNVGPDAPIVTLADLHTVWVMADLFEQDVAHVRVGQPATVTSDAMPGRTWTARVTYIDPEVARETRTVRVRVEVANPDVALRFGMFVGVSVGVVTDGARVSVPKGAVQTIGSVPVVYVADKAHPGRFLERAVVFEAMTGERVAIRSGIVVGDPVVVAGSFFLRAERDRLGWPAPQAATPEPASIAPTTTSASSVAAAVRVIEITAAGLVPARVTVPPHQPVDLVFIRRVEETCGTELLIPAVNVRRELPLNVRVTVRLEPRAPGELTFSCGMDMLKGTIIVK